jgi:phosphoglycolate phosphatase
MRPLVLLFDIDGTLVTTGGAGRRAIARAFGSTHGREDACSGFDFSGMTDRAILRGGLTALGEAVEAAAVDAILAAYLAALTEEIASSICRVHAGIEEALAEAHARPRCAVGLGTGNVREGARIKLTRVGLYDRFAFGGFGCDHEDRAELIRMGAERGAERLGLPRSDCRVVVIGDTPRDVAAAQAIGAECIAVATGNYHADALRAAGARHVYQDLTAPAALALLLGE